MKDCFEISDLVENVGGCNLAKQEFDFNSTSPIYLHIGY